MKFTTYLQKTLENWTFWETRFRDRVPESRASTQGSTAVTIELGPNKSTVVVGCGL